jgi:hypothetical protein
MGGLQKLLVSAAMLGFSVLSASRAFAQSAEKIVIPAGTKFRASLETPISSKISEVGDPISISLLEPIVVEERYVLPRGTEITGRITQVTPASRSKRPAEIYALFNEIPTSYGSEPVFVSVASADDVVNDEKIKTDAEGKLKANSSKGKALENAAKGASLGSIASTPVAIATHSVGPALAGPAAGAIVGYLLSKGRDIRLPVGSVFRMKFDRDAVLPASQFRLAPTKPVLSPAPESKPPGQ